MVTVAPRPAPRRGGRLAAALLGVALGLSPAGCRQAQPFGPGPGDDPRAAGTLVHMPEATQRYSDLRQHTFSPTGSDADPILTPDNRTLVFASSVHGPTYNLYEKSVDGHVVSLLTEDPEDERFPRLAPDGKTLAFAANREGNWDLYRKPLAARGDWVAIAQDPEDELWPTWSPDGRSLAYCILFPDGWTIRTIDVSGKKSDVAQGILPAWHPSRPVIAFQRARGRDEPWYAIWTIDLETGRQSELVSGLDWAAIHPTWSPDGKWLLFTTVHKSAAAQAQGRESRGDDFWVVPAGGGLPFALTDDDDPKWSPYWARDGRVYFVTTRGGAPNVHSFRPILPAR